MTASKDDNVPDVIQARVFQLVDDDGKIVAELSLSDGLPELNMKDSEGNLQVSMSIDNSGSNLQLRDFIAFVDEYEEEREAYIDGQDGHKEGEIYTYKGREVGIQMGGDRTDNPFVVSLYDPDFLAEGPNIIDTRERDISTD